MSVHVVVVLLGGYFYLWGKGGRKDWTRIFKSLSGGERLDPEFKTLGEGGGETLHCTDFGNEISEVFKILKFLRFLRISGFQDLEKS